MWNLPTLKQLGLKHKDKRYKISDEVKQAIKADCNKVPRETFKAIAKKYNVSATTVRYINNPEMIKEAYRRYSKTHKRTYAQRKSDIYRYREHIKSLIEDKPKEGV